MKARLVRIFASLVFLALWVGLATLALAYTAEGSFERTLKVTGPVELNVTTGSGNVTVRTGDTGSAYVRGIIRVGSGWHLSPEEAEKRVQYLESNPPVEQTGNSIHIGRIADAELRRHVSISYELTVPVETRVTSHTGSGDQSIVGVRGPVRAEGGSGNLKISSIGDTVRANTGSGDIELESVKGSVYAETGSGNVRAVSSAGGLIVSTGSGDVRLEQTAPGSVEVETGSGNVEIRGAQGSLRAHTGSGNITVDGTPTSPWKLNVGSGNISVRLPADAAFDLHAHTGSGNVTTDVPITVTGKIGRHELRGKVRGGGVLVEAGTGSGDIHIH